MFKKKKAKLFDEKIQKGILFTQKELKYIVKNFVVKYDGEPEYDRIFNCKNNSVTDSWDVWIVDMLYVIKRVNCGEYKQPERFDK